MGTQTTTIQALDARKRFGELLELAYYKGEQFRIARKDKPMAWIVGEPFIKVVSQAIDYIVKHKPALADTLAISLDDEIRAIIEQGSREVKKGDVIPIETILDKSLSVKTAGVERKDTH